MLVIHSKPLVEFTIGLNFFPKSISVADRNGKGKGGGELDTFPIECAIPDPSKGGRDKETLQRKSSIKTNTGQRNNNGKGNGLPCRRLNLVVSHESNAIDAYGK